MSLSIALALPLHLPGRDLIIVATFSVIVVTVLVQGTTLEWLLRAIGLVASVASEEERDGMVSVRARALQVSVDYLQAIRGPGGEALHPQLIEDYARRSRAVGRFMEAIEAEIDLEEMRFSRLSRL